MPPNFQRLAYVLEFLVALLAVLELWSQVGGQGHLDLMPWYTKLSLSVGLALATVAGTAAAVSHPDPWNAKTIACVILGLLIAMGMAAATYYYHLHENDDERDGPSDPGVARTPSRMIPAPGGLRARCRLLDLPAVPELPSSDAAPANRFAPVSQEGFPA